MSTPSLEDPLVSEVLQGQPVAKVTVVGVPYPKAAQVFRVLAAADVQLDMITQRASVLGGDRCELAFTVDPTQGGKTVTALYDARAAIGFTRTVYDDQVGKVSLLGSGVRSYPGMTAVFCETLAAADVRIDIMSTSERTLSVLCPVHEVAAALAALRRAFHLDVALAEAG
ncbi:ACT domain-containing protein [Pseudonocardiaceae bacterium YIM PH 21723]|nr:ACT domain-containing protein [Pseudonocardiaceae bacterium YIM PH 21723]